MVDYQNKLSLVIVLHSLKELFALLHPDVPICDWINIVDLISAEIVISSISMFDRSNTRERAFAFAVRVAKYVVFSQSCDSFVIVIETSSGEAGTLVVTVILQTISDGSSKPTCSDNKYEKEETSTGSGDQMNYHAVLVFFDWAAESLGHSYANGYQYEYRKHDEAREQLTGHDEAVSGENDHASDNASVINEEIHYSDAYLAFPESLVATHIYLLITLPPISFTFLKGTLLRHSYPLISN